MLPFVHGIPLISPSPTENYLALYTNYSSPHVAVGKRETANDSDEDEDALPYRAAVLGDDEDETTPDDFEILSHTKRGKTRLEALRNLLAHLEHRAAEGIDRVEEKTRKEEEKEKAAAVAKEKKKSMVKKGAMQKGKVAKVVANKDTAQNSMAGTRKVLAEATGRKQGARIKSRRTEEIEEDPDMTESAHENTDTIEVVGVTRGQKTVPSKIVPNQTKRKRTQANDEEEDEESDQPLKKARSRKAAVENSKDGDDNDDEIRKAGPYKPTAKPLNRQALLRKQRKEAKEAMQIKEDEE